MSQNLSLTVFVIGVVLSAGRVNAQEPSPVPEYPCHPITVYPLTDGSSFTKNKAKAETICEENYGKWLRTRLAGAAPQDLGVVRVDDVDASISGFVDSEAVRRVVEANLKQMKSCYKRGLVEKPDLQGKIVIRWTIGSRGRVLDAAIRSSTMNSPAVERCAIWHLKAWHFPNAEADQVAVVTFPFVFRKMQTDESTKREKTAERSCHKIRVYPLGDQAAKPMGRDGKTADQEKEVCAEDYEQYLHQQGRGEK